MRIISDVNVKAEPEEEFGQAILSATTSASNYPIPAVVSSYASPQRYSLATTTQASAFSAAQNYANNNTQDGGSKPHELQNAVVPESCEGPSDGFTHFHQLQRREKQPYAKSDGPCYAPLTPKTSAESSAFAGHPAFPGNVNAPPQMRQNGNT